MANDIKTLTTEIVSGCTDAETAIAALLSANASLQADVVALQATVGNVPDEDVTAIRNALAALKASYTPSTPAPAPAPQPAPTPPTN